MFTDMIATFLETYMLDHYAGDRDWIEMRNTIEKEKKRETTESVSIHGR